MATAYWIDGYNLILRMGWQEPHGLRVARERLLRELVPLNVQVRVFFDSREPSFAPTEEQTSPSSWVQVEFSRGLTADDHMLTALRRVAASGITIVSDDRELRGRAKTLGANTLGLQKFLQQLAKAQLPKPVAKPASEKGRPSERRLKQDEVKEWMDYFGFDDGANLDSEPGGHR